MQIVVFPDPSFQHNIALLLNLRVLTFDFGVAQPTQLSNHDPPGVARKLWASGHAEPP